MERNACQFSSFLPFLRPRIDLCPPLRKLQDKRRHVSRLDAKEKTTLAPHLHNPIRAQFICWNVIIWLSTAPGPAINDPCSGALAKTVASIRAEMTLHRLIGSPQRGVSRRCMPAAQDVVSSPIAGGKTSHQNISFTESVLQTKLHWLHFRGFPFPSTARSSNEPD